MSGTKTSAEAVDIIVGPSGRNSDGSLAILPVAGGPLAAYCIGLLYVLTGIHLGSSVDMKQKTPSSCILSFLIVWTKLFARLKKDGVTFDACSVGLRRERIASVEKTFPSVLTTWRTIGTWMPISIVLHVASAAIGIAFVNKSLAMRFIDQLNPARTPDRFRSDPRFARYIHDFRSINDSECIAVMKQVLEPQKITIVPCTRPIGEQHCQTVRDAALDAVPNIDPSRDSKYTLPTRLVATKSILRKLLNLNTLAIIETCTNTFAWVAAIKGHRERLFATTLVMGVAIPWSNGLLGFEEFSESALLTKYGLQRVLSKQDFELAKSIVI